MSTVMGSRKGTGGGVCNRTAGVLLQVHVVHRRLGGRCNAGFDVGLFGC